MKTYIKVTMDNVTKLKNRKNFLRILKAFEETEEMSAEVRKLAKDADEIYWMTEREQECKLILHFKYEENREFNESRAECELSDKFQIYTMEEIFKGEILE